MRILISILLASSIFLGYQKLSQSIAGEIAVEPNSLNYSEFRVELTQLESIEEYSAIARLPLFNQTRRPPVVEVKRVVKRKPVEQKLQIQALGIAVTSENLLAVVKDLRTGKIRRLRIDEKIDGWTLKRVADDSFVFERKGVEQMVKFKNDRG
ncbi:MAG: hypothetical protein GY935_13285 [Gammaproteobacteria bacterium]|nr:hypothetical protein [Gammaproteobacteria bacterium]